MRTDYGIAHSSLCHHERFGRDFSSSPLISDRIEDSSLVLLGHSFGGTTVRLFSELLAHGDPDEQKSAPHEELSGFFKGGMEKPIRSIVTLASPINGTSAYDLFEDENFDPDRVKVPFWSKVMSKILTMGTKLRKDRRIAADYADYDMHIDNALKLNQRIPTLQSVYYFSVPCCSTIKTDDGTCMPDRDRTNPLFLMRSCQIGKYSGITKGGYAVDEKWRANDGLVNTFSAQAPLGSPQTPLDRNNIRPGIWNVFPIYNGDHLSLQGGLLQKNDIRDFYLDLLSLIEKTICS